MVTISSYTADEDFALADKVVTDLGDEPNTEVGIKDLETLVA